MKILFVTGEVFPFLPLDIDGYRVGALAEQISCIDRNSYVSVVMPLYFSVSEALRKRMHRLGQIRFAYGWRESEVSVYRLRQDFVEYYFLENDIYFGSSKREGSVFDGEKYAFFAHAVLASLETYIRTPDIMVASGWKASPVLMALKYLPQFASEFFFKRWLLPGQIEEQGIFPAHMRGDIFSLGDGANEAILNGFFNLLYGAFLSADLVLAPSRNDLAAWEDSRFSGSLAEKISAFRSKIQILPDGFHSDFSPKDDILPYTYTAPRVVEGKQNNKLAFMKSGGFVSDPSAMLVAVTEELDECSAPLYSRYLPKMLEENVRIVFCCMGKEDYAERIVSLADRYPGRLRVLFMASQKEKCRLLAAADLSLVLSSRKRIFRIKEAMRFGTPVFTEESLGRGMVHPIGQMEENGFLFSDEKDFYSAFHAACTYFIRRGLFHRLFRNAVRTEFGTWRESAETLLNIGRRKEEAYV